MPESGKYCWQGGDMHPSGSIVTSESMETVVETDKKGNVVHKTKTVRRRQCQSCGADL